MLLPDVHSGIQVIEKHKVALKASSHLFYDISAHILLAQVMSQVSASSESSEQSKQVTRHVAILNKTGKKTGSWI